MGLDIFHRKVVSGERHEGTMQMGADSDGTPNPIDVFSSFAIDEENTYIDWKATFARKNLDVEDYSMSMWGTDGQGGAEYRFFRKREEARSLPEKVEFFQNETTQDLCTFKRTDRVIPYVEIGYQRKSVSPAFYDEFEGWEVITDRARVERIGALTDPQEQGAFNRNFLDNWEDGRSFVVVWY